MNSIESQLISNHIEYAIHNHGKQFNVKDLNGVIHSYYPTTGTLLLHHSNNFGDRKTKTLRDISLNELTILMKKSNLINLHFNKGDTNNMQKPNSFDEVQVTGSWKPAELGGHHMVIKQVSEKNDRNGNPMIVVLFDFATNDKQSGYFMESFKSDIRPDKKWPFTGSQYINVMDYRDKKKTSKAFKTFISLVQESNAGFQTTWGGANWGEQFKGLKIGGVFGQVENEYNGKTSMRNQLRWFVADVGSNVEAQEIPPAKRLKQSASNSDFSNDGFLKADDSDIEELPFN